MVTKMKARKRKKRRLQQQPLPSNRRDSDQQLQLAPLANLWQRAQLAQLQAQAARQAGGPVAPALEAAVEDARGHGRPLSDNVREPMEQAFQTDFGDVRVHLDAQADRLNRSVQARAFASGQDVFFRQGAYNPHSQDGQQLLAHELTHIVQQNGSHPNQIQRKVNWVPGARTQTKDLVDTVTAFTDFGITPTVLNTEEFPGDGDSDLAIVPPVFQSRTTSVLGRTAVSVYAEPQNMIGYRMELPLSPPWYRDGVPKALVASAVGMLANDTLENKLRVGGTDGNTQLQVEGLPDDAAFEGLVADHEDHHVEELLETTREILVPWDEKIKEYKDKGREVKGSSLDAAKANFYKKIGGTPEEIGAKMVQQLEDQGNDFHTTTEGSSPSIDDADRAVDGSAMRVTFKHPLG